MEEKITVQRGWHCTIIENHVINSDISCHAKMVYVVLCMYANKDDKSCYPSLKTICKDTSIKSKTTVKKGIDELIEKGFLEVVNRKGDKGTNESNLYIIKDYPISGDGIGQEMIYPISGDDIGVGQEMIYPISGDGHKLKPINKNHKNDIIIPNKDSSIKDIYIVQSEELWKQYPVKAGKGKVIKKIPDLIKKYGFEQMQNSITRYLEYVEFRRSTDFKGLQYQNGSTFFNSGYKDYLDENYTPVEDSVPAQKNYWDGIDS